MGMVVMGWDVHETEVPWTNGRRSRALLGFQPRKHGVVEVPLLVEQLNGWLSCAWRAQVRKTGGVAEAWKPGFLKA